MGVRYSELHTSTSHTVIRDPCKLHFWTSHMVTEHQRNTSEPHNSTLHMEIGHQCKQQTTQLSVTQSESIPCMMVVTCYILLASSRSWNSEGDVIAVGIHFVQTNVKKKVVEDKPRHQIQLPPSKKYLKCCSLFMSQGQTRRCEYKCSQWCRLHL